MKRHAMVDENGIVTNIIIWDESSSWKPPVNFSLVNVEEMRCDIGWKHENGVFTDPTPPEDPVTEQPQQ